MENHYLKTSTIVGNPHIAVVGRQPMPSYERIRDEHWLRDKAEEGAVLILEDDSVWEVHPSDNSITLRWVRGSTIYVEEAQTEDYPYVLRNRTEGEFARASFMGQFRAAG